MRTSWGKPKEEQLDLVGERNDGLVGAPRSDDEDAFGAQAIGSSSAFSLDALSGYGQPLMVAVGALDEDPSNPRTEFPDAEITELANDIALRGILQPIVVRLLDNDGRYQVLFGAKRLRAARQAGLAEVPVVIGSVEHDVYAQVAENQKRHGLTPLDLASFMRSRADAGESNAEIARRLGVDQTTVAHHLALLTLPAVLDQALRSGRCASPRTLYELAKLHETQPEQVRAIISGEGEITRRSVATLKKVRRARHTAPRKPVTPRRINSLAAQASDLCARLESLLQRMSTPGAASAPDELAALRQRLAGLAGR